MQVDDTYNFIASILQDPVQQCLDEEIPVLDIYEHCEPQSAQMIMLQKNAVENVSYKEKAKVVKSPKQEEIEIVDEVSDEVLLANVEEEIFLDDSTSSDCFMLTDDILEDASLDLEKEAAEAELENKQNWLANQETLNIQQICENEDNFILSESSANCDNVESYILPDSEVEFVLQNDDTSSSTNNDVMSLEVDEIIANSINSEYSEAQNPNFGIEVQNNNMMFENSNSLSLNPVQISEISNTNLHQNLQYQPETEVVDTQTVTEAPRIFFASQMGYETNTAEKESSCSTEPNKISLGSKNNIKSCSAKEYVYDCLVCGMSFTKKFLYRAHMRSHKPKTPAQKTSTHLRVNGVDHKDEEEHERSYKCFACKRSFAEKASYAEHMEVHDKEKVYQCTYCKKSFIQKFLYRMHMLSHGNNGVSKKSKKKNLHQKKSNHNSNSNTAKSSLQKKADSTEMQVQDYVKMFKCSLCDKNFQNAEHLKHHGKVCSARTVDQIPSKNSVGVEANKKKEKIHNGSNCSIMLEAEEKLQEYVIDKKSNVPERKKCGKIDKIEANGEKYDCLVCKESFQSIEDRSRHMSMHPVIKLYKCPLCNQAFLNQSLFELHMERHLTEHSLTCLICKKIFKSRQFLINHLKTHIDGPLHKNSEACKKFTKLLKKHDLIEGDEFHEITILDASFPER